MDAAAAAQANGSSTLLGPDAKPSLMTLAGGPGRSIEGTRRLSLDQRFTALRVRLLVEPVVSGGGRNAGPGRKYQATAIGVSHACAAKRAAAWRRVSSARPRHLNLAPTSLPYAPTRSTFRHDAQAVSRHAISIIGTRWHVLPARPVPCPPSFPAGACRRSPAPCRAPLPHSSQNSCL